MTPGWFADVRHADPRRARLHVARHAVVTESRRSSTRRSLASTSAARTRLGRRSAESSPGLANRRRLRDRRASSRTRSTCPRARACRRRCTVDAAASEEHQSDTDLAVRVGGGSPALATRSVADAIMRVDPDLSSPSICSHNDVRAMTAQERVDRDAVRILRRPRAAAGGARTLRRDVVRRQPPPHRDRAPDGAGRQTVGRRVPRAAPRRAARRVRRRRR